METKAIKPILLSIIVPLYNKEDYIIDCLQSLDKKAEFSFEVIVVDDGSEDESANLCKRFISGKPHFRYFYRNNEGLSSTRNFGISISKGKYYTFIDADDFVSANYFYTLKRYLCKDYDCICFNYFKLFKSGSSSVCQLNHSVIEASDDAEVYKKLFLPLIGPGNETKFSLPKLDSFSSVCTKIYKKEISDFHNITFRSTELVGTGEDLLFNCQFFPHCKKMILVLDSLYFYRNMAGVTTHNDNLLDQKWPELFSLVLCECKTEESKERLSNRIVMGSVSLSLALQTSCNFKEFKNRLKNYRNNNIVKNAIDASRPKVGFVWKIFLFAFKKELYFFVYIFSGLINYCKKMR